MHLDSVAVVLTSLPYCNLLKDKDWALLLDVFPGILPESTLYRLLLSYLLVPVALNSTWIAPHRADRELSSPSASSR